MALGTTGRQVGALVVKDHTIISDGYNGTPSGFPNVCEENDKTFPYVLHAEANAITKLARSNNNSDGATLYVTAAPCIECAKLIIQSGIRRVIYGEEYRLADGQSLLRPAGIEATHYPEKHHRTHQFKDGTDFDSAVKLYYFDFNLRNILLKPLSRIDAKIFRFGTLNYGNPIKITRALRSIREK